MSTNIEINETLQLMRTLKTSQVRKQLEHDTKQTAYYLHGDLDEWVTRAQIVQEFFANAKEQQ